MSPGAPPGLADLVRSRSDVSARYTHGIYGEGGDLELPKVRSEPGKSTFPFRAVTMWNALTDRP